MNTASPKCLRDNRVVTKTLKECGSTEEQCNQIVTETLSSCHVFPATREQEGPPVCPFISSLTPSVVLKHGSTATLPVLYPGIIGSGGKLFILSVSQFSQLLNRNKKYIPE